MAVTQRTLRLQTELAAQLATVTDAQTRTLVSAWADAWDEVNADLTAALLEQLVAGEQVTRAQLLRSVRLRKALAVVADQLTALAKTARVTITSDLHQVVDTAGAAQASVIDSQLPPGTELLRDLDSWTRVDPRQIDAIVRRSTEQITALTKPLAPAAYDAVRRELIRGVASGTNPRQTAARMVRRAEGKFNGGLTRALVISRTETLDAHRRAAELAQAEDADVLAGWSWLARLDARTCRSCWAQHGQLHPLTEPGPHDHQQGRCSRLPVTKSWTDLGFDVEEPPSLIPSAAETFDALSSQQQVAILGPRGYAAWSRGGFPLEAWSQRRDTPGWRPSYVVAPAPSTRQSTMRRPAA